MLDDFADPEEELYVYYPPEFSGGHASRDGVRWQPLVELKGRNHTLYLDRGLILQQYLKVTHQ